MARATLLNSLVSLKHSKECSGKFFVFWSTCTPAPITPLPPRPLPKTTQWQFWTTGVCVRSWVCLILFHQRTKCHLNGSSAHLFCVTENCHSRYTFFQERVAQTFPSNQNKVWLAFAKCVLSVFVFWYSWIFHWLLSTGIELVTKFYLASNYFGLIRHVPTYSGQPRNLCLLHP